MLDGGHILDPPVRGWQGTELLAKAVSEGDIVVLQHGSEAATRIFDYMARFKGIPCDYADASPLVAADETGIKRVFTIDGHFYAYRLSTGESLQVYPGV